MLLYNNSMTNSHDNKSYMRKARIEDFLIGDDDDYKNQQSTNNNNRSYNDNDYIQKNQESQLSLIYGGSLFPNILDVVLPFKVGLLYFESELTGNDLELMAKDVRTQPTSQKFIPTSSNFDVGTCVFNMFLFCRSSGTPSCVSAILPEQCLIEVG